MGAPLKDLSGMDIMMQDNYRENIDSWKTYLKEYSSNTAFSESLIHVGLGLPGVKASSIVKDAKRILDVGCGDGSNDIILAKDNAELVAIDIVEGFYKASLAASQNITFIKSDFINYKLEGSKYDLVLFLGSLDYIPLTKDFFDKLNSITLDNARCYISKFHPFWTSLFKGDTDAMALDNYFLNRQDVIRYGNKEPREFVRFHYSLSTLFDMFKKSGWKLSMFREPCIDYKESAFKYTMYESDDVLKSRLKNIPMTLIVEFSKEVSE